MIKLLNKISKNVKTDFFASYYDDVRFSNGKLVKYDQKGHGQAIGIGDKKENYFYTRIISGYNNTGEKISCNTSLMQSTVRLVAVAWEVNPQQLEGFVLSRLRSAEGHPKVVNVINDYDTIWKSEMPNTEIKRPYGIQVVAIDFDVKFNINQVVAENPCDWNICEPEPPLICRPANLVVNSQTIASIISGGTFRLRVVEDVNFENVGFYDAINNWWVVPGQVCPSITVAITGNATPNQFESNTYTATVTGSNGASSNPSDYSFMWIVRRVSDNAVVFAQGASGVATMDITINQGGEHVITVTVSGQGLSASNTLNVDVQVQNLFFNTFTPSTDAFPFSFRKLNNDYAGVWGDVRRESDGQILAIPYDGGYAKLSEMEAFRGGSELRLVRRYNDWTFGNDFIATSTDLEIRLTDGAGNLNLNADGQLFIRPRDIANVRMQFQNNITGAVLGTAIYVIKVPANGTGNNLLSQRSPSVNGKASTNDLYGWGKDSLAVQGETIAGIANTHQAFIQIYKDFASQSKWYVATNQVAARNFSNFNANTPIGYGADPLSPNNRFSSEIYECIFMRQNDLEANVADIYANLKNFYTFLP